jgi:hypothetical protein
METKIDNIELKFINNQKINQKNEERPNNLEFFSKDKEFQEISPKIDQKDFTQSSPSLPTERKASYDSESICPSQAETLSQTSESSFFFSYANANSQALSANDIIQIEKKTEKQISFFHGAEEHFYKLMPEKFIDYTNTKNYIHKKNYFKKNTTSNHGIKNRKQNIIYEDIQMSNYFYFPVVYYPYPINSFYFNSFPNININDCNNNKTPKENNTEAPKDKNSDEKKIEINAQKEEKNEEKAKINEPKDDKSEEKKEFGKEEEIGEEKEDNIEVFNSKRKQKYYNNTNKYNYRNSQDYNYKNSYNNKQRYYKNYNNRQYNKNTNYYYYDNENFQDERNNYYYNNNYNKRRYQKPFENRFYNYK